MHIHITACACDVAVDVVVVAHEFTGAASHPYAMTLSSPHDAVPGYVIAGHAVGVAVQPIGRLLKVYMHVNVHAHVQAWPCSRVASDGTFR